MQQGLVATNVLLTGGNAKFPQYEKRFFTELRPMVPDIFNMEVRLDCSVSSKWQPLFCGTQHVVVVDVADMDVLILPLPSLTSIYLDLFAREARSLCLEGRPPLRTNRI